MSNRPILKLPFKIKAPEGGAPGVVEAHVPAPANGSRAKRAARYPLVKSYHANRRS